MRNAYFAGIWKRAAAQQTNVAVRVMRVAEWSDRNEGFFGIEQAGDAMNLRRLNRFIERERRDDCWDALGEH